MKNRILRLDLLRAIAIMLVFSAHTVLSYGAPQSLAWLQFGGTGVDLFFVLSGWLIGTQLFSEANKYNNIDIKRFWIRRWMRTLPAYYTVLIFTILQLSLTKENFEFPWKYFLFLQNYDYPLNFFSVSWSLCVEEQFYLAIAPIIFITIKLGSHQRTIVLATLLTLPSLFRVFEQYQSSYETHVRWDCCIMGILLSNLQYSYPDLWEKIIRKANLFLVIGSACYIFSFINRMNPQWQISDPSKLFLAFIFGALVIWASAPQADKLFSKKIIMYISTRSYAIYLLHPEALALCSRLRGNVSFIVYFTIAFSGSCIISEILYKAVELPIMKLRGKYKWSCSRSKLKKFD